MWSKKMSWGVAVTVAALGQIISALFFYRLYADLWGKVSHRHTPREPVVGSCQSFDTQKRG